MKAWFAVFSRPVFIWLSLITLILSLFSYGWFFSQDRPVLFEHSLSNSIEIDLSQEPISQTAFVDIQKQLPSEIFLRTDNLTDSLAESESLYESLDTLYWVSEYASFYERYKENNSIQNIPSLQEIKNIEQGVPLPILDGAQEKGIQSYEYEAKLIKQPEYLDANETGSIELTLKNTGVTAWKASDVSLITQKPYRHKSIFYDPDSWIGEGVVRNLPKDVAPQEEILLSFLIKAPSNPALYRDFSFGLGLKRGNTWLPIPGDFFTLNAYVLESLTIESNYYKDFSDLYSTYQTLPDSKKNITSVFAFSETFSSSEIEKQIKPIFESLNIPYQITSPEPHLPQFPWLFLILGIVCSLGIIFMCIPQISLFLFEVFVFVVSSGFFLFISFFHNTLANPVSYSLFLGLLIALILSHLVIFKVFFSSIQNKELLMKTFLRIWKKTLLVLLLITLFLTIIFVLQNYFDQIIFLIPVWISIGLYPIWFHLYLMVLGEHSRTFHFSFFSFPSIKITPWMKRIILVLSMLGIIFFSIYSPKQIQLYSSQFSLSSLDFSSEYSLGMLPALAFKNLSEEDARSLYTEMYKKPYVRSIDSLVDILPTRQTEKIPIINALKQEDLKPFSVPISFEKDIENLNQACSVYKQFQEHPYFLWCGQFQNFIQKIGSQSMELISSELSKKALTVYQSALSSELDRPISLEHIPEIFLKKFQNSDGKQSLFIFLNSLVNQSIPFQSVLEDISKISHSWNFLDYRVFSLDTLLFLGLMIVLSLVCFSMTQNFRSRFVLHYVTLSTLSIAIILGMFYFTTSIHVAWLHALICLFLFVQLYLMISSKSFIAYETTPLQKEELERFLKNSTLSDPLTKEDEKIDTIHKKKLIQKDSYQDLGGYTSLHNEDWYHFIFQIPDSITIDQVEVFVVGSQLSVTFPLDSKSIEKEVTLDEEVDTSKIQCEVREDGLHVLLPKIPAKNKNHDVQDEDSVEIETVIQPIEVYERDIPVSISNDSSHIYISITLDGISKKHLDIEADELHIFLQSKDTTLMHFKKDIELPYPIMVDEIKVNSTEKTLELICPRKHSIQRVEILE